MNVWTPQQISLVKYIRPLTETQMAKSVYRNPFLALVCLVPHSLLLFFISFSLSHPFSPIFTEQCIHKETHKSSVTTLLFWLSMGEKEGGDSNCKPREDFKRLWSSKTLYSRLIWTSLLTSTIFWFFFNINVQTWNIDLSLF